MRLLCCFHSISYFTHIADSQTSWCSSVFTASSVFGPRTTLILHFLIWWNCICFYLFSKQTSLLLFSLKWWSVLYGLYKNTLIMSESSYSGVVKWDDYVSWKTTYSPSFEEKRITWPPLFGLKDVLLVLALKNCLNFLSIKTKRGNNLQAKCVSRNRLYMSTFILTCSFTSRAAKWIWSFLVKSLLRVCFLGLALFHIVLWYLSCYSR